MVARPYTSYHEKDRQFLKDRTTGSTDEDGGDEAPQIIVLKEGKHLTAREVENIKRKEKGLPPLPEHDDTVQEGQLDGSSKSSKEKEGLDRKSKSQGLSFSSSSKATSTSKAKRKAAALLGDSEVQDEGGTSQPKAPSKKKKQDKKLLSFGDDAS